MLKAMAFDLRMRTAAPVAIAFFALAGCLADESGRVAAQNTGGALEAPAPRLAAPESFCGEAVEADPSIRRHPYLQGVSDRAGTVVWTATAPARVVLSTPAGERLDVLEPRVEATEHLADATQYVARAAGLEPGTVYCYALEGAGGRVLAGPHDLRTAPAPGAEERVDIVVFGDSGGATEDQLALARQLPTVPADLMLHTGDLAYLDGTLAQLEAGYFDVYEPLLARIPMFPTSGNHDYDTDSGGPYREVFVLPNEERWYSFDWGPVHVVALDTERDGAEQAEWLRRDLEANDRPWTIVTAHKGPYSSGPHGGNGAFRELYQPLLEAHGVQLVLTGHDHHYERHEPIGGVTYIVTGGGGWSTRRPSPDGEHTAFAEGVVHFVYLAVEGDTLRAHAIDATGREFDAVEIPRERR